MLFKLDVFKILPATDPTENNSIGFFNDSIDYLHYTLYSC